MPTYDDFLKEFVKGCLLYKSKYCSLQQEPETVKAKAKFNQDHNEIVVATIDKKNMKMQIEKKAALLTYLLFEIFELSKDSTHDKASKSLTLKNVLFYGNTSD